MKVYELATNLTSLDHNVFLFIPKLGFPEQQTSARVIAIPSIDLPTVRFVCFQFFSLLAAIWLIARYGRPDIIYVRIMWSFGPMLLGKLFHIPVLLEVNDSPHRAYSRITSKSKRKLIHVIDRFSYRLSEHIFPVTSAIADDLHHKDHVPLKRMTVLPSGSNTRLFRPLDKYACCEELGFDPAKKYVAFIGTFVRHQGIDVLIQSAPSIIETHPEVYFLLVGDGQMKAVWQDKVKELGLETHFIFTGQVPYALVPQYCGVADICVSPFLKEAGELSPVKVFDYLACGKPVVMGEVADTGKIFYESEAVLFVQPEDPEELATAIKSLITNDQLRKSMGKKGRNFIVSNFDRKDISQKIEEIAESLRNKHALI